MKTKRRLLMENLERRIVLDAAGLNAVIVTLHDGMGDRNTPNGVASEVLNAYGGQLGHTYEHAINGFSVELPDAALEALMKNPLVKRIEPDIDMHALGVLPTGVDRIDTELNSVAKIDGIDVRVDVDIAIIDTGIDEDHPDLNVAGGYNATRESSWDDGNGHGTHVAGTAAALDNDFGVVGVAPGARLWAVKVLNSRGNGKLSDIIKGIDWVTAHANEIEVANMSLGGQGLSETYHEAIQASVAAGVVYVVAAGNNWGEIYGSDGLFGTSDDFIPAAYPEVAAIAAFADSDGQPGGIGPDTSWGENGQDDAWWRPSNFSNSDQASSGGTVDMLVNSPGLGIDLVMPGVDIYSTYRGGGYETLSGTSMASPHAAGLAGLYIAANGRASDATVVANIRQALIDQGKAWADPLFGISTETDYYVGGSPDRYLENLGWAGMPIGNQPPVAEDDAATTQQDSPVTISVLANDTDVENGVLTVVSVSNLHQVVINPDDTVTYTPAAGYVGSDSFTYTVRDPEGGTDSATVNVTVTRINTAPEASADSYNMEEDTQLSASSVLDNDWGGESDPLTAVLVTGPANGTLTLDSTGTFTYDPDPDFTGGDSFTYVAHDGIDASNIATVTITINAVNDPPVAADDTADTNQDTAVTIDALDNDTDVDGDALEVASFTTPLHGTVANLGGGLLQYTPEAAFLGVDTFVYTINDGNGGTDTATISITVHPEVSTTMHVGDLEGTSSSVNRRKWEATVFVTVLDGSGIAVANATVNGSWSNGVLRTATTDDSGMATVYIGNVDISITSVTFTVNDIVHTAFEYTPGENTDADGDSNGTMIVVNSPQSFTAPGGMASGTSAGTPLSPAGAGSTWTLAAPWAPIGEVLNHVSLADGSHMPHTLHAADLLLAPLERAASMVADTETRIWGELADEESVPLDEELLDLLTGE